MDYIHLSYLNSNPFFFRSSNDASGDKFLPANEETTPVFPFIPSGSFFFLRIERTDVHLYESEEDISNKKLPTFHVPFDDSASLETKEKDRGR